MMAESSADSDQDFDPTAEMLVNDFDDEHTLEEEEALESAESVTNELDDLQREGEMPLGEVLAMYGYGPNTECDNLQEVPEQNTDSSPLDSPCDNLVSPHTNQELPPASDSSPMSETNKADEVIDLGFYDDTPDVQMGSSRPLLRSVHHHQVSGDSSDTGTDYDYSPDDDWRKTIQVGSDYQAVIPEGLSEYDDAPAYENEDRLLWDPTKLSDEEVVEYLKQSHVPKAGNGVTSVPTGSHVRDDEQALFLLLQCGHNKEEALRRRHMHPLPPADTMSLWSEEECRSFETGLKSYGKDFHMIQLNKVKTRAVGELVQFYYLWKKTERHDVFATKNRIEKKKYALHPGCTDYMDRFLDEQENPSSIRDRSSSPSLTIPLFWDKKSPLNSPEQNADTSMPELSTQSADILDNSVNSGGVTTNVERDCFQQKIQDGNGSNKEYVKGENRVTNNASPPKCSSSVMCLNLESLTVVSKSMPLSQDSSSSMHNNPPNNVVDCSHTF